MREQIVMDLDLGGEERGKDNAETQRARRIRREEEAGSGPPREAGPTKAKQEGRASPAPTRIRKLTVECGDYGYYRDGVAD